MKAVRITVATIAMPAAKSTVATATVNATAVRQVAAIPEPACDKAPATADLRAKIAVTIATTKVAIRAAAAPAVQTVTTTRTATTTTAV